STGISEDVRYALTFKSFDENVGAFSGFGGGETRDVRLSRGGCCGGGGRWCGGA
ncbi:hypothetical protein A2U01_0066436, partial [Trifolium medium]|nr:hypothetical protein [Trifolium medium]